MTPNNPDETNQDLDGAPECTEGHDEEDGESDAVDRAYEFDAYKSYVISECNAYRR